MSQPVSPRLQQAVEMARADLVRRWVLQNADDA
jgi:hypothetical protein